MPLHKEKETGDPSATLRPDQQDSELSSSLLPPGQPPALWLCLFLEDLLARTSLHEFSPRFRVLRKLSVPGGRADGLL